MKYDHEKIKRIKEQYPPGTRIELTHMSDPYRPVPPGTTGTVRVVDDIGTLHMKWDNGRALGVVPGEDSFRVLSRPEPEVGLQTLKLYNPLSATYFTAEFDGDCGYKEIECDLSPDSLADAEREILKAIDAWMQPEERRRGLVPYCDLDDPLIGKIQNARPSVELVDGELWGVGIFQISEPLSADETSMLGSWWNTQLRDVFDHDFSQVGISCEYGEIFVSFWSRDEDWQIRTEDEMSGREQQMGVQSL